MTNKNNRQVYFNGKFVDEQEAKISIYDSALMFGDMVFEMTRSFNQKQFKLEEHINRLLYGIKILKIPFNYTAKDLEKACLETIDINKPFFKSDDEHRLMIDVSRGLLGIYQNIENLHKGSNLIIADFPLSWTVKKMGRFFDLGINCVITSQRVIPSHLMDPKIKNRSRLFYLNANIEVSQFKGDNNWALMLDTDGFIAEGTGDNFFLVKDNTIITPEGRNILRGISRDYILNELSSQLGVKAIEKNIEQYDVYTADEAFITGTPFCMLPVTSLNGIKISDGKPGNIFNSLLNLWSKNIKVNIPEQIKAWNKIDEKEDIQGPTPYKF